MAKFTSYTQDRELYLETGGTGLIGSEPTGRESTLNPAIDRIELTPRQIIFGASQFDSYFKYDGANFSSDGSRSAYGLNGTITQETLVDAGGSVRYVLSDFSENATDFFMKSSWESIFSGNDLIYLGPLDDSVKANTGNDHVQGYGGNDYIDGGDGLDTAIYSGNIEEYLVNAQARTVVDAVANRDGSDQLLGVERLSFLDKAIAFDADIWDSAGSAYRLYKAAFDRAPDEAGLGYWIDQLDEGASLQLAASGFIHSAEFESLYGANPSDTLFLTKLYNNVLDRDPDQGGLNYWIGKLNGGMSRESALINFSESNENVSNVADLIANGIQYQPWLS